MSLLGVDVGTSGCKALVFSEDGARVLGSAYVEYDVQRPQPGWSELDAEAVWELVQECIRRAVTGTHHDPVRAVSVSSLGEAVVPVTRARRILGPSILNDDSRGVEFLDELRGVWSDERLFQINGNTLGNHYSLPKLLWLKAHRPDLFEKADVFLTWSGFVAFMLGAEPATDYSLANRTLLFDVNKETWSEEVLSAVGLERHKLPPTVPSGTAIGHVAGFVADRLGLPRDVVVVAGAHDQCANALGCGATEEGCAMLGMGTYLCMTPVYGKRPAPGLMIPRGLNVEHHAAPGLFVSFIYNQGGSLLKWYRNTFARSEQASASKENRDIYEMLLREMPDEPTRLVVLPHFTATGPPEFISDSFGIIAGLKLDTTRGEIAKSILESTVYYVRACVESLPETGISVDSCRAVGGGSKSDAWIQIAADVLNRPFVRPRQTEAGALGAAIMAGAGAGIYASLAEAVEVCVGMERVFEPEPRRATLYNERFAFYSGLWPAVRAWVRTAPL